MLKQQNILAHIAMGFAVFAGAAAGQPQQIQATAVADLRSLAGAGSTGAGSFTAYQVVGGATGFYFLVGYGPQASSTFLLHTDTSGRGEGMIAIPQGRIGTLAFSPSGELYVSESQSGTNIVHVYSETGASLKDYPLNDRTLALVHTNAGMMSLGRNGVARALSQTGATAAIALNELAYRRGGVVQISDHVVVTADTDPGAMRFQDLTTGQTQQKLISAPEVLAARRRYADDSHVGTAKPLIFNTMASGSGDTVYADVTGLPLADGAAVIRVDSSGKVLENLRFTLPAARDFSTSGNPKGYMVPSMMAVSGKYLCIADTRGFAAIYPLP